MRALQCGSIEKTLVSHNSLSESAQYLRSSPQVGVKSSPNGLRIKKNQSTSEKFVGRENERPQKNVKPQQVNSSVQTPRIDNPASGNRLRECVQNFETPGQEIQFTRNCENATFIHGVSVGRCCKTVVDVDDGFGDRTPTCREYTHRRADPSSRIFAAIRARTIIGPVLQVYIIQYLGINGIEIQILPTTKQERTSWVVICRGDVEQLHLNDPDHNPTSSAVLLERSVAKESEPCSTEVEQSSIEETHAKQFEIQTNPVYNYSEEGVLLEERKWNDIHANKHFRGRIFEAEVSKLVMRLVRYKALFIGNRWVRNCGKHFRRPEGKNSRTQIGFNASMKEATTRGSSITRISKKAHCTFVPFKDTLVGT